MPAGVNEKIWKKAKAQADKSASAPDKGTDAYYAYVRSIYNNMNKEASSEPLITIPAYDKAFSTIVSLLRKAKQGTTGRVNLPFPAPATGTAGKVRSFFSKPRGTGKHAVSKGTIGKALGTLGTAAAFDEFVTQPVLRRRYGWDTPTYTGTPTTGEMYDYMYGSGGRFKALSDTLAGAIYGKENTESEQKYKKYLKQMQDISDYRRSETNQAIYRAISKNQSPTDLYRHYIGGIVRGGVPNKGLAKYVTSLADEHNVPKDMVRRRVYQDILESGEWDSLPPVTKDMLIGWGDEVSPKEFAEWSNKTYGTEYGIKPDKSDTGTTEDRESTHDKATDKSTDDTVYNRISAFVKDNRNQLATAGGAGAGALIYMLAGGKKLPGYLLSGAAGAGLGYVGSRYGEDIINKLTEFIHRDK